MAASTRARRWSRSACRSSIKPSGCASSRPSRSRARSRKSLPDMIGVRERSRSKEEPTRHRSEAKMRSFNLSAWAVAHPTLMLFLIGIFGLAGLFSYEKLGRAEDPNFTIKVVIVSATWPGATASDMQEQVADRIEKKLQELPYLDKVTTYTKQSLAVMQVAFKDNTPAREVPELFYQLRKKVGDIKDDLPAGVIGPSFNDEYGDVDSILYMLTSDGGDYAQMKKVAEALRQRLLKVKNVTKVNLYGTQDEKIYVEFSNAKLATLGITPDQLFQSLARQNAVV